MQPGNSRPIIRASLKSSEKTVFRERALLVGTVEPGTDLRHATVGEAEVQGSVQILQWIDHTPAAEQKTGAAPAFRRERRHGRAAARSGALEAATSAGRLRRGRGVSSRSGSSSTPSFASRARRGSNPARR